MALYTNQHSYAMPANYVELDVDSKIAAYDADATPLLALTTKLNKKVANATTVRWWEDDMVQRWALVSATTAASTAATTINMATTTDAAYCDPGGAVGTLLYNPKTGEQILCTATAAAAITVTKGYSDAGTADTVAVGTALLRIGTVDYENQLSHTPLLVQPSEKTNFTEIFRDPIVFSGSDLAEMKYIGDDRMYKIRKLGRQHAVDIEQSMWLSSKKTGAATTARAMGGIKEFMSTTNQTSLTAALTEDNFEAWMFSVFRYTPNGGRNLFVFGGGKLMQALNKLARTALQTVPGTDNPYGVRFTRWISAQGDIRLVRHWLMHRSPTSTIDYTLERLAYAVNLDLVQYRPLKGRDTKLRMNIQENDRDGEKHEYLTEATLQFQLPKAHGTLTSSADFI
jgi:hypothetical protein